MRILIHDFAGHPFQIQLSRELAARGHHVTHVYAEGLPGPKGKLQVGANSPGLTIRAVHLSNHFRKYSPVRRLLTQRAYARDLSELIQQERPDVVLSGNTPIDVQSRLLSGCHRRNIAFVHWVQDVYFRALEFLLRPKFGPLANVMALPFRRLEGRVVLGSDSVIVIAPEFKSLLAEQWGLDESNMIVAENWAPLDEMKILPRVNDWSHAHGFGDEPIFLYSGTLGIKHRPDLLYALAKSLRGSARVVVLSEGVGRQYLESMPALNNLTLLGFQPYERLPEVLASADVLVATLEADAGPFAVPSKVLTYLCAGRPILLAAPRENLAASVVERSGGGIVADPDDPAALLAAAHKLAADPENRARLGNRARQYAESTFDISAIAQVFERVLGQACHKHDRRFEIKPKLMTGPGEALAKPWQK